MNNKLITPQLAETLIQYPLYSQERKKKDAICLAVFFIGKTRWYVLEGQPSEDDFILFSIVLGLTAPEYGYVSVNEMGSIEVETGVPEVGKVKICQDKDFIPCPLKDIPDRELQDFLNYMYND